MDMDHTTAQLFKTLGDNTRRDIFESLCKLGEMSVGNIVSGRNISQPAISKHLNLLKSAGLVEERKEGRNTYYRSIPSTLNQINDWTKEMAGYWEKRLDSLENLLDRMD